MANPQPDKFTILSSELLEATARAGFNGTQAAIVMWVVRNSYGWHRKTVPFPGWPEIARAINRDRGSTWRQGLRLLEGDVLLLKHEELGLQKDYDRWDRDEYGD